MATMLKLMFLFTLCMGVYFHVGTLFSLGRSISSPSLPCANDDSPKPSHESLRASFTKPVQVSKEEDPKYVPRKEPLWWMETEQDDWFERHYHDDNSTYHAVTRLEQVKDSF